MGTDITVHIERRNKDTGKWENISLYKKNNDESFEQVDIYHGRNHMLFSLLAGVENFYVEIWDIGCLVPKRGIPDDLSQEVKVRYGDGECYHSATWYDYTELRAYEYMIKDSSSYIKELKQEIKRLKNEQEDEYKDNDTLEEISSSLEFFMDSIRTVLNAYDLWYIKPNEVRVVIWFDS